MAKEPMEKKERKTMAAPAKTQPDFVDGFNFCFDTARVERGVVRYVELDHQPTNAERKAARAEGIGIKVVYAPETLAWLDEISSDPERRKWKYPQGKIVEGDRGFFVYAKATDAEARAFVKTREEGEALLRGDDPQQRYFDEGDGSCRLTDEEIAFWKSPLRESEMRRMQPEDFEVVKCEEGFYIHNLTDDYRHDPDSADPQVFSTRAKAEEWIAEQCNNPECLTNIPVGHRIEWPGERNGRLDTLEQRLVPRKKKGAKAGK